MKFHTNQYVYLKFGNSEYIEYVVTDYIPTGNSFMYSVYDYYTKQHKEIHEDNLYSSDEIKFKPKEDQVVVDFLQYCPYLQ